MLHIIGNCGRHEAMTSFQSGAQLPLQFVKQIMFGVSLAFAVVSAGLTALRFVEVDQRLFLGLVPVAPWIFLLSVLVAAALHSRTLVGCVGVASVVAVAVAMPGTVLPRTGCSVPLDGVDNGIVLYSHNVQVSRGDQDALVAQIESVNADIVVLQEADAEFVESLGSGLANYPHRVQRGWQAIFSRWDVLLEDDGQAFDIVGALAVAVDTPAGQLRVVNVHSPWPLKPGGRDVQIQQFEQLGEILAENEAMAIVALGDFNATSADVRYRTLASGESARGQIVDAHREVGCGFGVGWSPNPGIGPALLGIDHAVVSGAHVESYEVLGYAGGDHKGIAVQISLDGS